MKADNLSALRKIQQLLDDSGNFDKTLSFADFISVLHIGMSDELAGELLAPIQDAMIQNYMSFIPPERIRSLVSSDFSQARIQCRSINPQPIEIMVKYTHLNTSPR